MATFLLKFERYVQEAAWEKVHAKTLDEAMIKAMDINDGELIWEEEDEAPTHPRLYGVFDARKNKLVSVELGHLFETNWTKEDLRYQWGRPQLTDEQLVQLNISLKQWLLAKRHVSPELADDPHRSRWVYFCPLEVDGSHHNRNKGEV